MNERISGRAICDVRRFSDHTKQTGFEAVKPNQMVAPINYWFNGVFESTVACMHAVMKQPDCDQGI